MVWPAVPDHRATAGGSDPRRAQRIRGRIAPSTPGAWCPRPGRGASLHHQVSDAVVVAVCCSQVEFTRGPPGAASSNQVRKEESWLVEWLAVPPRGVAGAPRARAEVVEG